MHRTFDVFAFLDNAVAKRHNRKTAGDARRIDPQDVLDGRVETDAGLLFDLIHRVNPTGLGVSAEQQRSRYEIKSRLQSLLVKSHADELDFEAEPESDDIASIRHRHSARDACHAVLSQLDSDARFLVRSRLDEQAADGGESSEQAMPAPPPGSRSAGAHSSGHAAPRRRAVAYAAATAALGSDDEPELGELLARGRAALDAYLYEDARRFFRLAVKRSRGEVEAAKALLELLVDHLAAYSEALQAASELPPQTMRDPLLRVLAGRAAAECGRPELALAHVEGIRSRAAAEVHAVLASAALHDGKLERAAEQLDRANELARDAAAAGDAEAAPLLLELGRLQAELAEKRARLREPREREIERLLERGEIREAEQQARRLLECWPDSRAARTVLKRIEEQHKGEQVRALIELADEAYSRSARRETLQHLRSAMEVGGDGRALRERIEAVERELRAEEDEREVERVGSMLQEKERLAGLLAYLALDDELRARVREKTRLELLSWLEQGSGRRTGARARADAEAVLALEAAAAALEQDDPKRAIALIEPHENGLKAVDHARRIAGQAREALTERRRKRSAAVLASAREALGRGECREALRLLQEVEGRILLEPERSLVDELTTRASALADEERLIESYRLYLETGELLEARDAVQALAALTEGDKQKMWTGKQEALSADIRTRWRVRVIDGDATSGIDLRDFNARDATCERPAWLTTDGRKMVATAAAGQWLFLRVVETGTNRVQTAVMLRAPEPLGSWPTTSVQEKSVCVLSNGRLLELSFQTWDILRWCNFQALPDRCTGTDTLNLLPGGRFLWAHAYENGGNWKTVVLDLEQRRVRRVLPSYIITLPLNHNGRTLMLCSHDDKTRLYTETGAPFDFSIPGDEDVEDATSCPDGTRIALLLRAPPTREDGSVKPTEDDESELDLLEAVIASPDGALSPPFPLEDTDPDLVHCMATSLSAGLLFVLAHSDVLEPRLWAFRAEEQGLAEQYCISVSRDAGLVQDLNARHAALIDTGTDETRVFPLSGSAPVRIERASEADRMPLPSFSPPFFCYHAPEENKALLLASSGVLADTAPDERAGKLARLLENNSDEPESLLAFYDILRAEGFEAVAKQFAEWLAARGASHPEATFPLAEQLCRDERWNEALALLEPLVGTAVDGRGGEHFCHLLAIALIAGGRSGNAVDLLRRVIERFPDGLCNLEYYLQLAESMPSPLLPEHWGPDQPRVRQLAGAITMTDLRLAAGDFEGAREAIDRQVVWQARELQSCARLAEVYLGLDESGSEATLFFKVKALAEFCDLVREREHERPHLVHDLPFPGRTWNRERLGELAARARAWLDTFDRPSPLP